MKWFAVLTALAFCAVANAVPEGSAGAQASSDALDASTPIDVRVLLEPNVIPYHRQARFTIHVEAPANVPVDVAPMGGKFGGLEIYGQPELETKTLNGGRKLLSVVYTLDPLLAGDYVIQPVSVTWGETHTFTVPSPALRVRDLTDEEKKQVAQFSAEAGPVDIPLVRRVYVWGGVAALAAAALLLALWWFVRRRRNVVAPPPALPWEVAYGRLRALDQRKLPQDGHFELFYIELSSILRHYIEDRYRLHAPEQTTPEFLSAASEGGVFSAEHQRLLAGFLRHSDRVKFAKHVPETPDMEQHFADILRFIDETIPKPDPTAGVDTKEAAA